jgi:hypothetical protein
MILGNSQLTDLFVRCKENFPYIIHILHGLTHTARTGSVYITMAITIERYFATVHPFKRFEAKKILLIGACLFAMIYNIPKVSPNLKLCQYSLIEPFFPFFRLN